MALELSAQRTNLTWPRAFGGLLRPVARRFLVMLGGRLNYGTDKGTAAEKGWSGEGLED